MDGLFPRLGPLLHAIFSIARTICLLMLMVTPIFAGFIFFFSIAAADDFDLSTSIVKIIAMMLGHFNMLGHTDIKWNTDTTNATNQTTATDTTNTTNATYATNETIESIVHNISIQCGVLAFMILICVVIMNTIVGLTLNRINYYMKKGRLIQLQSIQSANWLSKSCTRG